MATQTGPMPRVTAVWSDGANADDVFSEAGRRCAHKGALTVSIDPPARLAKLTVSGLVQAVTFRATDRADHLRFNEHLAEVPCPRYECEKLVLEIGGDTTVRVAATFRDQPVCLSMVKPLGTMLADDEASKDFALTTREGTTVRAHLAVLAVHSEYFRAMLNFKEGLTATIQVEEHAEVWESILLFAYQRKLRIERRTMLEVVEIAIKYQIDDLRQLAWNFAHAHVDAQSAPLVFLFASRHEYVPLQQRCAYLVRLHALDLIHNLDWTQQQCMVLSDPEFGAAWRDAILATAFLMDRARDSADRSRPTAPP